MLAGCYDGEYVHNNDGSHMARTLPGSKEDRNYLFNLLPYAPRSYNIPGNSVGRGVVDELAVLINGVVDGKWTMIRVFLFLIVVLAESPDIRDGPAKRSLIRDRLTA